MVKTEMLENKPVNKLLIAFAPPAILSLLANSLNMAIDRMFVGRGIGTMAISAITIAYGIYLLIQAFAQLVGAGAASLISMKLGKKNEKEAEKTIGNAFTLSIIVSILITILGCALVNPLISLYGASGDSFSYTKEYTNTIFLGSISLVFCQSMNNIVRGMGNVKRSMINLLCSIIVNIILNPIFIFLCHLGVTGSALATIIGNLCGGILAIKYLCSSNSILRIKIKNLKLEKAIVIDILSIGLSGFIMQAAMSLLALMLNQTALKYGGSTCVASYGIVTTIFMLVYMPILGLAQGMQPIVGYNYGANLFSRVKEALKLTISYSSIFAIIAFCIIHLFTNSIVKSFGGNDDVNFVNMTSQGLKIAGSMLWIVGLQMVGSNYFQFVGKVKQSMILSALRQLIILIPALIILPKIFGVDGIWLSTATSDLISGIIIGMFIIKERKELTSKIKGHSNSTIVDFNN